jgi:hypothetical protein
MRVRRFYFYRPAALLIWIKMQFHAHPIPAGFALQP